MKRFQFAVVISTVLTGIFSMHCSNGSSGDGSETEGASSEAMVSSIASNYGVTTFGGAGDYQKMACGQNSRTANKWYVASSQRYGCHVHLQLTTPSGKCVVVSTEDAGPATFVEQKAGKPILDSSPAVAQYLFGESGLGWSDVKKSPSKYSVTATKTTAAVGPCTGAAPSGGTTSGGATSGGTPAPGDDDDDDNTPSGGTSGGAPSGGTSGGQACASDGQCNPGNDGAGLICSGGTCVPGCHSNAQCPGNTTCVSGQCQ
jgi:hypothetical protein